MFIIFTFADTFEDGSLFSKTQTHIVQVPTPNVVSSHQKMLTHIEENNKIINNVIVQTNACTQNIQKKLKRLNGALNQVALLQTQITQLNTNLDILVRKNFKNMETKDIVVCAIEIHTLVIQIAKLMSDEENSATNNLFDSTQV